MKKFLMILLAFVLAGCASKPTNSDIRNAYFGEKPNQQEKLQIINEYVSRDLIDPESLRLKCAQPRKGWARPFFSKPVTFGYVFACDVNAKNRMGGYTGGELYVFLFNDRGQQVFANKFTASGPIVRGMEFDFVE